MINISSEVAEPYARTDRHLQTHTHNKLILFGISSLCIYIFIYIKKIAGALCAYKDSHAISMDEKEEDDGG